MAYTFVINDGPPDIGNLITPHRLNIDSTSEENEPDWVDYHTRYKFTASMTAVVYNSNGTTLGDDGDILAAFDIEGNVRGISIMLNGIKSFSDLTLHAITIRGNTAGEEIGFKYYDASENIIFDIQ
tara:strand:- start:55 stop:432 length:378 start_codon:yes stop_codon:yes gene_type:complete